MTSTMTITPEDVPMAKYSHSNPPKELMIGLRDDCLIFFVKEKEVAVPLPMIAVTKIEETVCC